MVDRDRPVDHDQSRSAITVFVRKCLNEQNDHDQNLIDRRCLQILWS